MRIKTVGQCKDPRRPIKGVYMAVLEQKERRAVSHFSILK